MISRPTTHAYCTLAILVAASACQPKAAETALSPTDVAAIGAVLDAFPKEFKAKNPEGAVAAYASDAVLLEDGRINRGKESILKDHIKPESDAMNVVTFNGSDRAIKGQGGIAYTMERYTVEANDAKGKPMFKTDSAWYTTVQERQADGSWKVVLGHWSSPPPPQPAPAAPARKK